MYDINKVRQDFPILSRTVYDKPLVYLDNAATTQKPLCVLDAMRDEYLNVNANVHRGVHYLSQQATDLHEAARETVRKFINAPKIKEIIIEQLGVDEADVTPETSLTKDLEADSLDAVEIIMAIEEEYGIEVPDEEAEKFSTIGDIVKYVEENAEL